MIRPRKPRHIQGRISVSYFKPQGIPLRTLSEEVLASDELEALRLHDIQELNQTEAAARMKISQATLARTLDRAYKKIARALVEGKAIRIENSDVE